MVYQFFLMWNTRGEKEKGEEDPHNFVDFILTEQREREMDRERHSSVREISAKHTTPPNTERQQSPAIAAFAYTWGKKKKGKKKKKKSKPPLSPLRRTALTNI